MQIADWLGPAAPWVRIVVAGDADFSNLTWSAARFDPTRVIARTVRGHKAKTVKALFDEFSAALQFPYYFGENWDAFDECLTDLEWLWGDAYVILIARSTWLLSDQPEAFTIFIDLLKRAAREWSQPDPDENRDARPFRVIFQSSSQDALTLRDRLRSAGLEIDL